MSTAATVPASSAGWAAFSRACEQRWRGWLRQLLPNRPAIQQLSIETRLDLGARKSLLVVAYGGRRYLVATSADTISTPVEIRPSAFRAPTLCQIRMSRIARRRR